MTKALSPELKAARKIERELLRNAIRSVIVDVSDVNVVPLHDSPVRFMFNFFTTHRDTMSRREMIKALHSMNVFNPLTVRTQAHRFFATNGDLSEWNRRVKAAKAA